MQTHQVKRNHPNKSSRQIGRGGKRGKTSGRGGKGQTARAGAKVRPEMRDFIKRLPKLRGRGKHGLRSIQTKPVVVSLKQLENNFSNGDTISPKSLAEKRIIKPFSGRLPAVKILSNGVIIKALTISGCLVSVGAKEKIIKAGGEINIPIYQ